MGFIALPVLGLFLLLRQQGPIGIWKIALLGTGIAYLVVVAHSFPNLYFGIAVAHISFVSTLLWYALGASEFGNSKQTDAMSGYSVISILSALIIPVCTFQIVIVVISGLRFFENVGVEPCANLMRSWLAVTILLSMVLLFGRQYYWRELNWFEDSLHKRATEGTILFYLVTGFMAAMIYPFFLSDFPNPIRILFCMFQ